MTDFSQEMLNAVAEAFDSKNPLCICGAGSKTDIIGRAVSADTLDVSKHTGIVDYHSSELVITARAGTPLTEIKATLAKEQQMLSFEPPLFNERATLGGTLACNLSGPARPWAGSIRDMVLGVQLINGKAELLNYGGQVMKNVAGYDVSRLQAGALGTLGVLTQVSLKVLPVPEHSLTLSYELDSQAAIDQMVARSAQPKPLSAASWLDGQMFLRLSGTEEAVEQTAKLWGGEQVRHATDLWQQLRDMNDPCFSGSQPLWRFSHKPSAGAQREFGDMLIDWAGAQRWVRGEQDRAALEKSAENAGGHVSLFRGGDRHGEVKHSAGTLEKQLQQRLKHAFDPAGILNPGRMYSWM